MLIALSACGNSQTSGSSPTVGYNIFNGNMYIDTDKTYKKAGRKLGKKNGNVYYKVLGHNPNKEIAIKIAKNNYSVQMNYNVWKNTKDAQKFLKSEPALKKALEKVENKLKSK